MKKLYIAIALFILIIGLTISSYIYISSISNSYLQEIHNIEDDISLGNWDSANTNLKNLHDSWENSSFYLSMFIDDFDLDKISKTFYELEPYLAARSIADSLSHLTSLTYMIHDLHEGEKFIFINLF